MGGCRAVGRVFHPEEKGVGGALVNNKNRVGVMAAMQMFCGSVGGILVVNFWQCWQRKFISSRVGSDLETFDAAGVVVHFKKSRSPEVCDVCHDGKHWVKNARWYRRQWNYGS